MVVLSAVLHVAFAVALVWGPSWISPRPIAPPKLVSLPVDEVRNQTRSGPVRRPRAIASTGQTKTDIGQ
jgi:hypothetical protein